MHAHKLNYLSRPAALLAVLGIVLGLGFPAQPAAAANPGSPVINCLVAPCEQAEVTSPVQGEVWKMDNKQEIKWAHYSEYGSYANIYLNTYDTVTDSMGAVRPSYQTTIATKVKNNGRYVWSIPASLDNNFIDRAVQVSIHFPALNQTIYSPVFSISKSGSAQLFKVTSPKEGEQYGYGSKTVIPIRWNMPRTLTSSIPPLHNFVNITLQPSWSCGTDPNLACPMVMPAAYTIASNATNSGEYNWSIPADLAAQFTDRKARIVISLGYDGRSASSGEFTILSKAASVLTVTSPQAGSAYVPKETVPIRWNDQRVNIARTYVKITLMPSPSCLDDRLAPCQIRPRLAPYVISNRTLNDGQFDWEIPARFKKAYFGEVKIQVEVLRSDVVASSDRFILSDGTVPVEVPHPVGSLVLGLDGEPTSVSLIVKAEDGLKRKVFPSGEVFMSHGYKWEKIVPANQADQRLPVIGGMTFAPGSLVKPHLGPDPRVHYLVTEEGKMRPFANMEAMTGMGYRANMAWPILYNSLAEYKIDQPITIVERHPDGTDVIEGNRVYYIDDGIRRDYENIAVYNSWHTNDGDFSRVVPVNRHDLSLPVGTPVGMRYYPN